MMNWLVPGQVFLTRSGHKAKVRRVDRHAKIFPVVCEIPGINGLIRYTMSVTYLDGGQATGFDLVLPDDHGDD